MEAFVVYLGFVTFSFVGAREIAGFMGDPTAYFVAGAAFAGHITGGIGGLMHEKKWGHVTGVLSLAVSLLVIVTGASLLIGHVWPLAAAVGAAGSGIFYWLAERSNTRRKAQKRKLISDRVMVTLVMVPCLAVIALAVAVGYATGWY